MKRCSSCPDLLDAAASAAGSDRCSACSFELGEMVDGSDPIEKTSAETSAAA